MKFSLNVRYISAILLATFAFSCKTTAPLNTSQEATLIRKVLENQQNAWNNNDLDGFMQGYLADSGLTFVGAKGVTYGWKQTLENYKKGYPDKATMGRLEFEVIQLDVLSHDSAYMIGKYTLYRDADTPSGHFTLLWKKVGGAWKIFSDHTSS